MTLHPVETAYRNFRIEYGHLLPELQKLIQVWEDVHKSRLPEMVGCPRDVCMVLCKEMWRGRFSLKNPDVAWIPSWLAWNYSWRQSKVIYQVDPLLAEDLAESKWPDKLPCSAAQLPRKAI